MQFWDVFVPDSITNPQLLDNQCRDPDVLSLIRVRHWSELDVVKLEETDVGWNALTFEERHYFLPAYIIASLDEELYRSIGTFPNSLLFEGMLCGDNDWDSEVLRKYAEFRQLLLADEIIVLKMVFDYWVKNHDIDNEAYQELLRLYR